MFNHRPLLIILPLPVFLAFVRVELTEDGYCPGCKEARLDLERSIDTGRQMWMSHSSDNNNHLRLPSEPLIPGLAWPEEPFGPVFLPTRTHSCGFQGTLSIARTWYYPHNVLRLRDPEHSIVHFRLHFHLAIPGELNHRWTSSAHFDATFPLFGALRRFWGRVLRIARTVFFMGERRTRTRRVVTDLGTMRVAAEIRRPGVLRMNRFSAQTHLQLGPRIDGMILGMSLQWHSEIDEDLLPMEDVAIEPEARPLAELCFPLRRPIEVPAGPRWTR